MRTGVRAMGGGYAGGLRPGIVRAVGESAEGTAETALRCVTDTPRCFTEARKAASEGGRTPWKRGVGAPGPTPAHRGRAPGRGCRGPSGEGVTGMFHVELPCSGVSAREDARCSTQPTATPSPSRRYDRAREVRGWLAAKNHAYGGESYGRRIRGWLAAKNRAYWGELWAEDVRVGLCPAEAMGLRWA